MDALLTTIHGSHLYGLAHAGSDLDRYAVLPSGRRPTQTIRDGIDITCVPLSQFAEQASRGVPQALEAMWSPLAEPGPLDAYRRAFRPDTGLAVGTYARTIRSFSYDESPKKRRHALRLAVNLADLTRHGWFSPRLAPAVAQQLTAWAALPDDDYLDRLAHLAPVAIR